MNYIRAHIAGMQEAEKLIWIFALASAGLLSLLLFATEYHPAPVWIAGVSMLVIAGLLHARIVKNPDVRSKYVPLLFILSSILITVVYFIWHPRIPVDDAGFIIRYLRQTDVGCWYCFNASEGPVYGISGFLHGLISLLLYQAGAGAPETCLLISNITGFFCTALMLILFLNHLFPEKALAVPVGGAIMLGAKSWVIIAGSGMETPVHAAVICAAMLACAKANSKWFWALLALAVISKMDAAPVALAWGALYLWQRRSQARREIMLAIFFAGIPLLLWTGFTIWVFGSPLPHSASVKTALHIAADQHWFPFLQRYLTGDLLRIFLALFIILWPLHTISVFRRRAESSAGLLPGFAFAALIGMYFFYNPKERMEWYYAVPDVMLCVQTVISLRWAVSRIQRAAFLLRPLAVLILPVMMLDGMAGMHFIRPYFLALEGERVEIGKYLEAHAQAGDTVLAAHGLPLAFTEAFAADLSALNSKAMVRCSLRMDSALVHLRPDFAAVATDASLLAAFRNRNYYLDTVFYESVGAATFPWLVLAKADDCPPFFMHWFPDEEILSGKRETSYEGVPVLSGDKIIVSPALAEKKSVRFTAGIRCTDKPITLWMDQFLRDTLKHRDSVLIPAARMNKHRSMNWHGIAFYPETDLLFSPGFRIQLWAGEGEEITVAMPALTPAGQQHAEGSVHSR